MVSSDGNDGHHLMESAMWLSILSKSPCGMYLQCLLNEARSPSPIRTAVYSIDWAMQLAGLPKVGDHPLVVGLVHASHIILGKPTVKKEPVTPEMLKALVKARITDKCPSLSDIRMVAVFDWLCRVFPL